MKILLLEDHPALAEVTCLVLRNVHGHTVEHAATGAAALQLAEEFKPELTIVDLNLPDMDGYEVAARLRARPEFDAMILVTLTGLDESVDSARGGRSGVDAQFCKPMDFSILPSLKRATGGSSIAEGR